jgi:integrase
LAKLYEDHAERQFKEAKMTIDFKNIRTFTTTSKFNSGGQLIETEKSIDPKVIDALRNSGLSTQELSELVLQFMSSESSVVLNEKRSPVDELSSSSKSLQYVVDTFCEVDAIEREEQMPSDKKGKIRRLLEIIGGEQALINLTVNDADKVRKALSKLPKDSNKFRDLKVDEIIEKIERVEIIQEKEIDRFSPKHINNHLVLYTSIFKFALDRGWVNANIFTNVRAATKGKAALTEQARREQASKEQFNTEDLSSIFSTPLYTSFSTSSQDENYKFWLPLIGLFTGARVAQIASLDCNDIKQVDGLWIIDFNVNNDKKSAKNKASIRQVPIHSNLLDFGIIEFAEIMKEKGERLFPELSHWTTKDGYSRKAGKWFKSYLNKTLNTTKVKKQSFHSFRSTLVSYMRTANVAEPTRNKIIGWSVNDDKENLVVRNHYTRIELAEIKLAIDKIDLCDELKQVRPFEPQKSVFGKRPGRNEFTK